MSDLSLHKNARIGELRVLSRHTWVGVVQLLVFAFTVLVPQTPVRSDYWADFDNDGTPEQHADDEGIDTDGDGLRDGFELYLSFTDPLNWDSNSDGYADGDEYHQHYGVNYWFSTAMNVQGSVTFADIDGDGVPNWLDAFPVDGFNGTGDRDNDGTWDMFDAYPDDFWNGDPWMGQPHYTYNGTEYPGTWSDQDMDGIPDVTDGYPYDATNGASSSNFTFWSGIYFVNGSSAYLSCTYSNWVAVPDLDYDGIPDLADPYPYDATNNTSFWAGGEYWVDGIYRRLWEAYLANDWGDADSDGIPDQIDPYEIDFTNNTSWGWQTRYVDGVETLLGGAYSSSQPLTDTDNDGIFDFFDPYTVDATNNTSFIGGQYYAGHAFDGRHPEVTSAWLEDWFNHPEGRTTAPLYLNSTAHVDTDGDTIPDVMEDFFGLNKNDHVDASWMGAGGNGYTNLERYLAWQDLRNPGDPLQYAQWDGIPNVWKVRYGFDLQDPGLFAQDFDGDGLDNVNEYVLGTDPLRADTDMDGESDGVEAAQKSNPNDPNSNSATLDSDGDGYSNGAEIAAQTDPFNFASNTGTSGNGGSAPGTSPLPPSGIDARFAVFTSHRTRSLGFKGLDDPNIPMSDPPPGDEVQPPDESSQEVSTSAPVPEDDGFNGDADFEGNNFDEGDPRDLIPSSPEQSSVSEENTASYMPQPIGPGRAHIFTGDYVATNAFDRGFSHQESSYEFDPATGRQLLSAVSFSASGVGPSNSDHGWQGNGYLGLASYEVQSSWQERIVEFTNSYTTESGEQGTSSEVRRFASVSMNSEQVRLQCNKDVGEGTPVAATFMVIKSTSDLSQGGGGTAASPPWKCSVQLPW